MSCISFFFAKFTHNCEMNLMNLESFFDVTRIKIGSTWHKGRRCTSFINDLFWHDIANKEFAIETEFNPTDPFRRITDVWKTGRGRDFFLKH